MFKNEYQPLNTINQFFSMKKYILILLALISLQVQAQDVDEVTSTFLIKNAMVVSQPGATPTLSSILIKDGIIQQVSSAINAPFDAKVVDLDSMYVYAGFIDPYSQTGIKKPEAKEEKPKVPGLATLYQSGVRPQVMATSMLNPKESSISSMEKQGFTISHVMPEGRMLQGHSALISLSERDNVDQMVLNPSYAIGAQLKGASGAAPATVIGVMAKFRDVFENAKLAQKQHDKYNANPTGMVRPMYSEEMNALSTVVNNEKALFFRAEKPKDILRVLKLQKEYGFKVVLSEVKKMYHVYDQIQQSNNPVLLSLELPKELKEEEDKKDEDQKEDKEEETEKEKKEEPTNEEVQKLKKRQKEFYDMHLGQAAELEKRNIKFAFSYDEVKSGDIHKNIKRYIKAGLSEKSALAALTTSAADILGLSKVAGTVQQGKMANLVVSDMPIFEEKSKITWVVVEGHFNKMEVKKKKSKSSGGDTGIEGTWSYEVDAGGQVETGTITISKSGDSYDFSIESDSSDDGADDATSVEVNGSNLKATVPIEMGAPVDVVFDLEFSGESYEGTVEFGDFGSFPINGDKTGPKQ